MSFGNSGTFKNMAGHYWHQKKKKRDQLTSHPLGQPILQIPGVPVPLVGTHYRGMGPFIAETIWICNGDTATGYFRIYDYLTPKTCHVTIAPGVLVNLSPIWMPFFNSVMFDASSINIICTMGGWIP